MWSRVQIVALTALLAASYLPDRAEAEPGPPAPQSTVLFQRCTHIRRQERLAFGTFQCARARQQDRQNLN